MAYTINTSNQSGGSPTAIDVIGMAPRKPFLNNGTDPIAVYPTAGSIADAVVIEGGRFEILPPLWSSVSVISTLDPVVTFSCVYTTIV